SRDGEREVSLVRGYYRGVDDAFNLDPLAILATRRHAVESGHAGRGQWSFTQDPYPGLLDLRSKVALRTDTLHLDELAGAQRDLGVAKIDPNTCCRILNK